MARVERLCRVGSGAIVLAAAAASFCTPRDAGAAESGALSEAPSCPDAEAVWTSVAKLVPSAAPQLLAARPRVSIVDQGDRYRVKVFTERGVLERVYADPARECDKRTRFAAEFIVLALMPPAIADETAPPEATPPPSATSPPTPPLVAPVSSPAPRMAPEREAALKVPSLPGPRTPAMPAILRIELSGLAQAAAPVLGAVGLLSWEGELRVRIGRGTWSAIAALGYLPKGDFTRDDLRVALTRVPAEVGVRASAPGPYGNVAADVGFVLAIEQYEGLSVHSPKTEWRAAPGLEANVIASSHAIAGFAPFVNLSCALFPFVQPLAAAPQGDAAKTPSLWVGAGAGVSFEL